MITARQSRAARALLGWTQETLADKAQVSLTALKRLDVGRDPQRARQVHDAHLARARWMTDTGYRQLVREDGSRQG